MRTIIELPREHIQTLDALCKRERISRAEAIRRAVAVLVRREHASTAGKAFGVWADRGLDGLAYQEELRREWDR